MQSMDSALTKRSSICQCQTQMGAYCSSIFIREAIMEQDIDLGRFINVGQM